jgi:hypothetical protein
LDVPVLCGTDADPVERTENICDTGRDELFPVVSRPDRGPDFRARQLLLGTLVEDDDLVAGSQ